MLVEWVRPIQERTRGYLDDPAQLDKLLAIGAEKARSVAAADAAYGVRADRIPRARGNS